MNYTLNQYKKQFLSLFILFYIVCYTPSVLSQPTADTNHLRQLYDSAKVLYKTGYYLDAVRNLNKVLKIKNCYEVDFSPKFYKVYNRLGIVYRKQGNIQQAIYFYKTALNSEPDDYYASIINSNIANIYSFQGDYLKAIVYYEKVLNYFNGLDNEDKNSLISDIYHNIGYAYYNSGNYEHAISNYLISIEIGKRNGLKDLGDTYLSCGLTYLALDSIQKAERSFSLGIKSNVLDYGKEHIVTVGSYVSFADFYIKIENYARAEQLFEQIYDPLIRTAGLYHPYTSFYYKYRGDLFLLQGEYSQALESYQHSLISKIAEFNDSSVYQNPPESILPDIDILDILKGKAEALYKISNRENQVLNLKTALKTLELKVYFINRLRTNYLHEKSKLSLSESEYKTYLDIINISYHLIELTGDTIFADKAFKYAEHSKYAVLQELNNDETARSIASVPEDIRNDELRVREQIGALSIQIENERRSFEFDSLKIKRIKENLFRYTKVLENIISDLELKYPEYYKLKNRSGVSSIKEIQYCLRDDQIILEYVISGKLIYTFLITKDDYTFHRKKVDSSFFDNLKLYHQFLNSQYSLNYDTFRISAYSLYETLLEPFENKLEGKSLLIIPDEKMSLMSFEALVDEPFIEAKSVDYSLEPYIVRKYPIGYAYSASLYRESLSTSSNHRNRILAMAPSYEKSRDSLPILPINKKHLRKITAFRGVSFFGENATETKLKELVSKFNILHLYAHGYEDSTNASLSRIFFADYRDTLNDSYLFAHEINSLNISAELIVLASCFSGAGVISEGEGVLSIGRSFLRAGGSSLILSLWSASYSPTMEELSDFHKYLLGGKRKDEALRLAKLNYLENANQLTAHPRYWASLVVIGNQNSLYERTRSNYIILFIGLLILGIILYLRRKRKQLKLHSSL